MTTEVTGTLSAAAPFSLTQAAAFLGGFAPCTGTTRCTGRGPDTTIDAPFLVAGRAVLVRAWQDGPTRVRWSARADGDPPGGAEVADRVRAWLSLDDPVARFYDLAEGDPELAHPVAELRGLHQVRFGSLAEGVTWFTITHRVSQHQALGWKRELARRYGQVVRAGRQPVHAFPSLDTLLAVPEAELAGLLGAPYRVARLRGVLLGVAELGEQRLRSAPFEQARAELLAVRGIGPFTSDAVLFRVLGRLGPIGVGAPLGAQRRYGDWIGYWSYYRRVALARAGGRPR
jgi:DNA-3-methyladenine glycosylase II